MSADALIVGEARPDALALKRFVRHMKHLGRDALSARGTGTPPSCACGAPFSSFRARKEHIRACDGKPKAVRCAPGCQGFEIEPGVWSGCSCPDGKLANGEPQPPGFKCDCPRHPEPKAVAS